MEGEGVRLLSGGYDPRRNALRAVLRAIELHAEDYIHPAAEFPNREWSVAPEDAKRFKEEVARLVRAISDGGWGGWIPVAERLPDLSATDRAYVLAAGPWGVREMVYARNRHAKTERGRAPRWEEMDLRLAFNYVTHWAPLPGRPPAPSGPDERTVRLLGGSRRAGGEGDDA